MRVNLRIFLFIFLGFSFIVSFSYVNRCSSSISNGALCSPQNVRDRTCPNSSFAASSVSSNKCACSSEQIDVDVNDGEALVSGRKEGSEVFVPFNFVRKYFDIYGKFEDVGETRFLWSHRWEEMRAFCIQHWGLLDNSCLQWVGRSMLPESKWYSIGNDDMHDCDSWLIRSLFIWLFVHDGIE